MKSPLEKILISCSIFLLTNCQTTSDNPALAAKTPPPEITSDMDLEAAIVAGQSYGGNTLLKVKKLVIKRKEREKVAAILSKQIGEDFNKMPGPILVNTLKLYQTCIDQVPVSLFEKLVKSENALARDLGFNLAANFPSQKLAIAIDNELSKRLEDGNEKDILTPQMANAVRSNELKTAYTIVREGLMIHGDDQFARAMIVISPQRASNDFLDYLALAPVEELRQINQKSVNIYACMVALRHFIHYPPSLNHPQFSYLFLYSVSRNQSLAELASTVLESHFPKYKKHLALILARLPVWVQVSYVETAARDLTPSTSRFLAELKKYTTYDDVVRELESIEH